MGSSEMQHTGSSNNSSRQSISTRAPFSGPRSLLHSCRTNLSYCDQLTGGFLLIFKKKKMGESRYTVGCTSTFFLSSVILSIIALVRHVTPVYEHRRTHTRFTLSSLPSFSFYPSSFFFSVLPAAMLGSATAHHRGPGDLFVTNVPISPVRSGCQCWEPPYFCPTFRFLEEKDDQKHYI